MAAGRNYTPHQKGIIKRFYENRDDLANQKLGELLSDLYLCESEKKATQLWARAEKALLQAGAKAGFVKHIVGERNLKALGELVAKLF